MTLPAPIRSLRGIAGRYMRGRVLHRAITAAKGAPKVMFLPSSGPFGSSLLRAYNVSDALAARGWASLCVHSSLDLKARRRAFDAFAPDLLVVQKSRHPLNDPEHFQGLPFVYDIDDADFLSPKLTDRMTRTCAKARGVMAGSRYVAEWCAQWTPNVDVIWTGTEVSSGPRPAHAERAPIVTWAQADPHGYPEEFAFVHDVLLAARPRLPELTLRLYGWKPGADEAMLGPLHDAGITVETRPPMSYEDFLVSLREVAIGLSPVMVQSPYSRGKSFGKILAYLDAQAPVIASDEGDHSLFFDEGSGVVSNDAAVWIDAVVRLLSDPQARDAMAAQATRKMESQLSLDAAVDKVEAALRKALDR
jgi:hypothetical protein